MPISDSRKGCPYEVRINTFFGNDCLIIDNSVETKSKTAGEKNSGC